MYNKVRKTLFQKSTVDKKSPLMGIWFASNKIPVNDNMTGDRRNNSR